MFSGDGTYNEVINGLRADIPVGFVPGGGTSVLPRALGLPRDPARAAARIAQGTPRRISLGRINGRRFAFNAGIGFDAELVRRVDALGRRADGKRPGRPRVRAGPSCETLVGAPAPVRAGARGRGARPGRVRAVANCSPYTYAGRARPPLRPRRVVRGRPRHRRAGRGARRARCPRLAAQALRGRPGAGDVLLGHDLDRIVIRCDVPLPVQVDGEDIGDIEEAEIVAERDALTVLT